ncbi:hypothetical protein [Chryseobacterium sp. RR2-3-20]|uniref:hypothetical protein n=1 Tax=Chryseobacterium sp. RR2-3-20 TaxID=2787626 RepID=UPI001AE0B7A3|nr:hypothetical protein [Chryseobacterium sp. RR2-3-20]
MAYISGSGAKYFSLSRNKLVEWLKEYAASNFTGKYDYLTEKVKSAMSSDDLLV